MRNIMYDMQRTRETAPRRRPRSAHPDNGGFPSRLTARIPGVRPRFSEMIFGCGSNAGFQRITGSLGNDRCSLLVLVNEFRVGLRLYLSLYVIRIQTV